MGNIDLAIAKLDKYSADMQANIAVIDALTAKVKAHATTMREKASAVSLSIGWWKLLYKSQTRPL
jgi:hypothetical protein